MTRTTIFGGAILFAFAALPAQSATPASMIKDALSAAPAAISVAATVMTGDGKVLRQGTNGWTCMPDDPATPGPDPMCLDKNSFAWMMALMGHKAPLPGASGMAYMLKGGSDSSNTDPYAEGRAGHWVTTGPHVMVLSADAARQSGYPGGATPDTSKPYIMFEGTPYAHIMLPVK